MGKVSLEIPCALKAWVIRAAAKAMVAQAFKAANAVKF